MPASPRPTAANSATSTSFRESTGCGRKPHASHGIAAPMPDHRKRSPQVRKGDGFSGDDRLWGRRSAGRGSEFCASLLVRRAEHWSDRSAAMAWLRPVADDGGSGVKQAAAAARAQTYRKNVLTEMPERSAIASTVVFSRSSPSSSPFPIEQCRRFWMGPCSLMSPSALRRCEAPGLVEAHGPLRDGFHLNLTILPFWADIHIADCVSRLTER